MTQNNLIFKMQTERDLLAREVPSQRVLELSVCAPEAQTNRPRIKLNLALIIDRSGSMSGEKLVYVKQAALHVVDLLQDQDRVALVAYDDEVLTLSESVAVTQATRERLKSHIQEIEAGGMTNLSGGWLTGCQQVAAVAQSGWLNRSFLLTDGLANQGITDLEELGHHASELFHRNISTSTFGVGEGFDEHLLEEMSNQGGGNFYFIEHPGAIPTIFMRELKELLAITAREVQVILDIPPQVDAQVLGGWKNELIDGKLHVFLGDLDARRQREVYLRMLFPPQGNQEQLVIHAKATGKGESGETFEQQTEVTLSYTTKEAMQAAPVRADVMQRFGNVEVADAANEALKLERRGETDKASRLLENVLAPNAPFMTAEKIEQYRTLSQRMKHGLRESDRKSSHHTSYIDKQRRQ